MSTAVLSARGSFATQSVADEDAVDPVGAVVIGDTKTWEQRKLRHALFLAEFYDRLEKLESLSVEIVALDVNERA